MFQKMTDQFAIGDETTQERLKELAQQNYTMIIDLCTTQENMMADDAVSQAGLVLKHVPISTQHLVPALVEQFMTTAEQADGSVYVRCASGRRAALMVFLTQATRGNWTSDQFFNQVESMGFDCRSSPQLAAFADEYLEQLHKTSRMEQ